MLTARHLGLQTMLLKHISLVLPQTLYTRVLKTEERVQMAVWV